MSRRDFTINAIALDQNFAIHDPFHGLQDIQIKLIRAVGIPHLRFEEDALRILRAIRFVSQLGFQIEALTYQAMIDKKNLIIKLSIERIHDEWFKLLGGSDWITALKIVQTGQFLSFIPTLDKMVNRFINALDVVRVQWDENTIQDEKSRFLFLLFLAEITEEEWHAFLIYFRFSNDIRKRWLTFCKIFNDLREQTEFEKILLYAEPNLIEEALMICDKLLIPRDRLCEWKSYFTKLPIYKREQLAINGDVVIALSARKKGVWVANILEIS